MPDFKHGMGYLNRSLTDLQAVQNDIKNDPEKVKKDWDRACKDISTAYKDLTGIKVDHNLKTKALEAYAAFKRAESHPERAGYIDALSKCINKLIGQLKQNQKNGEL
jgi:hypothetical protein